MELICSNCVSISSSSSSLLSPVTNYPKINRNYSASNRSRVPARIRAQQSGSSTVQLQKSKSTSDNSALEQLDIERGVCVPFRKYSPQSVRNKVLESRGAILSLIGRGVEIVWNLGFYWSTLTYDFLVGRDEEVVPFRARQLRNLLCDLGPSFIKAGQVNRYAFSGGQDSIENHSIYGANNLENLSEYIRTEYGAGRMLTGEVKKRLIEVLTEMVERHWRARAAVTDEMVDAFMAIRPLPNMFS